jgi:hypothetical protein
VSEDINLEQSRLRTDVETVRSYGEAHPEEWIELRFENDPVVRIVALFAGDDVHVHREALRRLVSHPDRLEVQSSPWSRARLEQIGVEIHQLATVSDRGLFHGWGTGGGRVIVRLRADAVDLARQIGDCYGDAVDLTVGFLHFPDCSWSDAHGAVIADHPQPVGMPLPAELHLAVDGDLVVKSGANLASTIRLFNEGKEDVVVHTNGQITASVVDPTTTEIVGGYAGAQVMPLVLFPAPAGGSVPIPLFIGTASTRPRLGYAVPPGRWAIEINLGLGGVGTFRAPPIPLVVVV